MKNTTLLISLILLGCNSNVITSEDKIMNSFYDSGELLRECIINETSNSGTCNEYYESGELMRTVMFKNKEQHGDFNLYYEDGNKLCEGYYEEGEEVGIWKIFHGNGQILMIIDESLTPFEKDGKRRDVFKSDGSLVPDGYNHEYLEEFKSKVTFFKIKDN